MGPDLSNIGVRPLAAIREAIVQPSKDLSLLGMEGVTVTLKKGGTVAGIARNRSNYALQLVDSKGALHLIRMADVAELKVSEHSIMPDDYAKRLSAEELRDLLAYLARQTARTGTSTAAAQGSGSVRYEDILKSPGTEWLRRTPAIIRAGGIVR